MNSSKGIVGIPLKKKLWPIIFDFVTLIEALLAAAARTILPFSIVVTRSAKYYSHFVRGFSNLTTYVWVRDREKDRQKKRKEKENERGRMRIVKKCTYSFAEKRGVMFACVHKYKCTYVCSC